MKVRNRNIPISTAVYEIAVLPLVEIKTSPLYAVATIRNAEGIILASAQASCLVYGERDAKGIAVSRALKKVLDPRA
jgi:GTP cyclohydrolase FolE2